MSDGAPAGRTEGARSGAAPAPRARRWGNRVACAGVFLAVLVVHFASPYQYSYDSRWAVPTAMSILAEGNTDLDEFRNAMDPLDMRVQKVRNHLYNYYPLGPALVALPFVAAADGYYRLTQGRSYESVLQREAPLAMESFVSSFCVALTAALLYLIAMERLGSAWKSLLVAFVFAFCTSAWSTASRSLWQHAPSMLMLTGTLYLFVLAEKKPKRIQFAGLLLAFAYVIRPTNSLSVAVLTVLVFVRHRRYFLRYLAWPAAIAVLFVAFNYAVYGAPLPSYFSAQRLRYHARFWEALAVQLVSPGRGLFVFSPVLALSLVGIGIRRKERRFDGLDLSLLLILVLHWVAISACAPWWAGHSYGPRLMTDVVPYFAYFLIPVVGKLARPITWRVTALASLLTVLAAASFFVHYRGAMAWHGMAWNGVPSEIGTHLERLWDWRDPPFLRWPAPGGPTNNGPPSRDAAMRLTATPLVYAPARTRMAVDPDVTVLDAGAVLSGATVRILENYAAGQDVLDVTPAVGIRDEWNPASGTLTMRGTASAAAYQAHLRRVAYSNASATPGPAARTVLFQVNDRTRESTGVMRTIHLTPGSAPILTTIASRLQYPSKWVAVDDGITVFDADNASLASATVRVAGNYVAGEDILGVISQAGITDVFDVATGTLRMTGRASAAVWEAELRAVAYLNNASGTPSMAVRTFTFIANDGIHAGNVATRTMRMTPDVAPSVTTTGGTLSYPATKVWALVDPGITVADADSPTLSGATIRITGGYQKGQDILDLAAQPGIVDSWDPTTGTLTLTGTASVSAWQSALRQIAYINSRASPDTRLRTLTITVNDEFLHSPPATRTITLSAP